MVLLSRRQLLEGAAGVTTLAAMPRGARSDDYPSRRIRLVIPYTAGAAGDQIGRPWVEGIASRLGPAYVENIAGAGGAIGTAVVAREAPDGHSLLLGNGSTQVIIPLASANPAYSFRDFRAVYRLISSALVFAIHPGLPVHNLQDLIAYAKSNPGKLAYGSPGIGTGNHLVGEMFKLQSGATDIVHVPYRGIGQATNDLVGGEIPLLIGVISAPLLQLNRAGKLRLLAVTTDVRLSGAPEIPTAIESGMPDMRYEGWFGLFAPKATEDPIIDRLVQVTRSIMADPALQETYRSQGMEPDHDSSEDKFQRIVEATLASLAPVIKSIGLKLL
jgi:tripartite-type tricarboxylate transporter receptor subunit TctC